MPRQTPFNLSGFVTGTLISNHIMQNPGQTRNEIIAALNITPSQFTLGWAEVRGAMNRNLTRTYRIDREYDENGNAAYCYYIESTVQGITGSANETLEFVIEQLRGIKTRIVRLDNGTMVALADILGTKQVRRLQRRLETVDEEIDDFLDQADPLVGRL